MKTFFSLHSTMFLLILSVSEPLVDGPFFTFHNVSINTDLIKILKLGQKYFTFHNVSINTFNRLVLCLGVVPLHSTMFLLIRKDYQHVFIICRTLHSTMFLLILASVTFPILICPSLHSTMFLLIPAPSPSAKSCKFIFTFHNVSINTRSLINALYASINFTFHNVSINTTHRRMIQIHLILFTFHNVSINTVTPKPPYDEGDMLYIPQCFY